MRRLRVVWRVTHALVFVAAAALGSFVAGALLSIHAALPEAEEISAYTPRATTKLWSSEQQKDGTVEHTLLARIYHENREPIELRDVPDYVWKATVAIEDRRFKGHRGVDPKRIVKAALVNIKRRDFTQGASTITQQLARNVWLTHEKTILRKLKEALLAVELERKYSKDEILEMYLNQVCYGRGAYGIEAASQLYLGKSAKGLTLDEAALLAGLPQRPRDLNPFDNPQAAKKRRDLVLDWMARLGYAKPEEVRKAKQEMVQAKLAERTARGQAVFAAPYFSNLVLRDLCDEHGDDVVYGAGLNIYTTIDVRLQKIAEKALTEGIGKVRKRGRRNRNVQGALVAMDPKTGRVLAMVGGVGKYEENQFNRAHNAQGRQCGSSFKPYVYSAAMESGWGPSSIISGSALSVKDGYKWHTIDNYTPKQGGNYTLTDALAQSVNGAAARLIQRVGIKKAQRYGARMMDIPRRRLRPVVTLALGTSEVTPLEMCTGYSTFATGGLRPKRIMVDKITDEDDHTLLESSIRVERVLEKPAGMSMLKMLKAVTSSGTGRGASRLRGKGYQCGGKTGTTDDGRDVWWIGFTPDLACAVWVGRDDHQPMSNATGSGFCLPVWLEFMQEALPIAKTWPGYLGEFPEGKGVASKKSAPGTEEKPVTLSLCADTGLIAGPHCPHPYEREYTREDRPETRHCTAHLRPQSPIGDTWAPPREPDELDDIVEPEPADLPPEPPAPADEPPREPVDEPGSVAPPQPPPPLDMAPIAEPDARLNG